MVKLTNKTVKVQSTIQILSIVIIIIAANIIGAFYFGRFDLTSEKKFSVSSSTKKIIKGLNDFVYIKVYLDGDLPANFKQLRNSTRELLDELRAYNKNVMFEFINPSENEDKKERFKLYKELTKKGLAYYDVPIETKDGFAQKTIFPSALISYREKTIAVNLVVSNRTEPTDLEINNSVQNIELNMINAIRKVSSEKIPSIVFASGHGELNDYESGDLAYDLSQTYNVGRINIDNKLDGLMHRVAIDSNKSKMIPNFDLVIIPRPTQPFSTKDLFIIDQYIMHGGKVIWALDMVDANMDSLQHSTTTLGLPINLNLTELFFKYGLRVNTDLILNKNALEIGTAEGVLRTWDFFPIAKPDKDHIITKNLTAVSTNFVSSIDTLASNPNLKKSVLLRSDVKSRLMPAPALIDLAEIIYRGANPALYNKGPQNIAVLLEGSFTSIFKNRMLDPRILDNVELLDIKYDSPKTSQLVISDGDLVKNQVMQTSQGMRPYPLGYDRFSKKMYENKKFIINAINYMLGDEDLINLRNKQYKIRLLDKENYVNSRLKWQLINTIIPICSIILLGLIIGFIRKVKYGKNNKTR